MLGCLKIFDFTVLLCFIIRHKFRGDVDEPDSSETIVMVTISGELLRGIQAEDNLGGPRSHQYLFPFLPT